MVTHVSPVVPQSETPWAIALFVEQDGSEGFVVEVGAGKLAHAIHLLGESWLEFFQNVGLVLAELDSA